MTPAPIADRYTAYKQLLEIVEFFRKDDPANPVPFLLTRAYRMGESVCPAAAGRKRPSGRAPRARSARN